MLTWGDDVEVHALRERGWSIAAIARHLGRDPKTIRAYVRGERTPGRRRSAPDPLGPFVAYLAARFADDPHIWASALYEEVTRLGYGLSDVSFARHSAGVAWVRTARPARACGAGPRSRSPTHQAPNTSGTGSSAARPPGAGPRTCCLAPCPTQGGSAGCSPTPWTSPTWSRRWTRCCVVSGAPPGCGGPTGWPRWSCPAPARCSPASLRSPATTALRWSRARHGGATARGRWRARSGLCAGAGGRR